ncbi:MAG: chemotaxis protein CheB [Oleiphilus sp.]
MQTANLHPQIGVISDCALQRHMIQKALSNNALEVAVNCDPSLFEGQSNQRIQQVNCWILVMDDEDFESDAINALIEQTDIPVLFGLDKAPNKYDELYISWERRLFSKLEELLGQLNKFESESSVLSLNEASMPSLNQTEESEAPVFISQQRKLDGGESQAQSAHIPASEVWILAASLGGPAAVKTFLDLIPRNIRASFLYAQHIDAHFSHVLTQVLGRHAKLNLMPLEDEQQLFDGEVRVVPVDHEVRFTNSAIKIMDTPWNGPYGPSIDHLLKNVVAGIGSKCHLIVFSGMGNDSAMAAPSMQKLGCQIWTQQPETCASASMPQSIIDMNCSNLTAAPEALAQALIDRVGCHAES